MSVKGRIYIAEASEVQIESIKLPRLVRATTGAQAFKHVATPIIKVSVATSEQLVNLCSSGVKVEDATEAAE